MPQTWPLRFGIFLPPIHKIGVNPTLALHRDLALVEHLDRLGFHEAWIGEHHSAGSELIASPEVFIAAAAERTKHIKLGTGVNSLPYHHPFMLADRIVMLDHLTRGRMMFGCGPGQLTTDAAMLGIDPQLQRPRMEQSFDVIMRLFRGETVTEKTDWFTCDEAVLQMLPYSRLRHRGGLVGVAVGLEAGRPVRHRAAVDRRHRADGLPGARLQLQRLAAGGRAERPRRASGAVAAHGADAHRRHRRAGQGELPPRPHVGVRLPQPHHPGRRPERTGAVDVRRAGRLHERERAGRDRHAGDGRGPDRAAHRQDRRLRDLPVPRCRPGRLGAPRCATTSWSPSR